LQVVGFGVRNFKPPIEMSDTLQRADLPIVPYEKCFQTGNDATFWNRLIPGENFCAGYKNGTSTCQGDSGGGIAFQFNGRWFLRGIVSFGPVRKGTEFCDPNNYSIFLDVAHYLEWIEKSIEQTKVYSSSSMRYLISLVFNFVMTFHVFVLIVSVLVLSNVCMLILYCHKNTERSSADVQFYANSEAKSSQAMLLNK
jgi:secreted trypsin-like serine protease